MTDTAVPVCFVDTETTSLTYDRKAWDIAIIRRDPDGTESTLNLIVGDVALGDADPASLAIGRFYERHPRFGGDPGEAKVVSSEDAAELVWHALRDRARVVGTVPDFDAWVLRALLYEHQLPWPAHHHLVDTQALAAGWLAARGEPVQPPWSSEELSRAVGVDPPAAPHRHTALGDALWARAIYDTVLGSPSDA